MLDFEKSFEGLTVGGRLNAKTKKKAKHSRFSKIAAKVRAAAKTRATPGEAKSSFRLMGIRKRKPKPKTLQEFAANKPPVRTHGANVKVKLSASGRAKVKVKPVSTPAIRGKMPSVESIQHRLKSGLSRRVTVRGDFSKIHALKPEQREEVAAHIAVKPLRKIAKKRTSKPAHTHAPHPVRKEPAHETNRKAIKAIRPIAQACRCPAARVVQKADALLVADGFPIGTASQLLAALHDMNERLEKAAIQRLATHEHNVLTAQHEFEHQVLERLANIAKCLPSCHPTRTRAHLAVLRKA